MEWNGLSSLSFFPFLASLNIDSHSPIEAKQWAIHHFMYSTANRAKRCAKWPTTARLHQ